MGYFFLALFLATLGGGLGIWIYQLRKYGKDKKRNRLEKRCLQFLLIGWILIGLAGVFMPIFIANLCSWSIPAGKLAWASFASYFFFTFFSCLWGCFYLRFYRPDTVKSQMKLFKIGLCMSIPIAIFAALFYFEGIAEYLEYPLSSGFVINGNGIHLFNAQNSNDSVHAGGLHIAWYGVIIVSGALICYLISDHRMYLKYGRHGILESTLFVAFPAGIIGARIWYVVGNWERDGFNSNFAEVFKIFNGGLTILGGAIFGIVAGALWVIFRRKYVDLRYAADIVVPTILIAQAIGRWGNFFNLEVYGNVVSINQGWEWVPRWIQSQMSMFARAGDIPIGLDPSMYNGLQLVEGYMNAPLFLVESLLNLSGFFIIYYFIPFVWRRHRAPGLNVAFYFIWYGTVRIIMEPLRNVNYNMGNDNSWSVVNAAAYIGIGVVVFAAMMILYFYRLKKGLPVEIIRGKAPKDKPVQKKKKSALEIVSEAQMKENEKKPERQADTIEKAENKGESNGKEDN